MDKVPLKLLLLDSDPIFRLGFVTAIEKISEVKVIADIESITEVFTLLKKELPDIIILDLSLNISINEEKFWQYLQEIIKKYPKISLFLLGNYFTNQQLQIAQKIGVKGYCKKGISLNKLISILETIRQGKSYWQSLPITSKVSQENNVIFVNYAKNNKWLFKIYQSGLTEINIHLQQVEKELKIDSLSIFDKQFLQGRRRELLAASWIIDHIFPFDTQKLSNIENKGKLALNKKYKAIEKVKSNLTLKFPALINLTQKNSSILPILENTLNFIQFDNEIINNTNHILEIDILKPYQKKELFYLILNQIYCQLEEVKFRKISPEELQNRIQVILSKIWKETTFDFIMQNSPEYEQGEDIKNMILKDTVEIQQEILNKIPLIKDLFNYWVFQDSIRVDNTPYSFNTPEANQRAEIILQNLIVKQANAILQFILNNFSENEEIKDKLYNIKYYSAREIAKFRNLISGKYRKQKLLIEPKEIFESKYNLYHLRNNKIEKIFIYYPRQQELETLQGLPWLITISLEFRDAIAPVLQGIVYFLGKGLIYILTQVIGKGLGLIGKGILQGVGYSIPKK